MTRRIALLAALLAVGACKPSSKEAPAATTPDAPVAEEAEALAEVDADEQVKVNPALVGTYIDFRKKVLEATRVELTAIAQRLHDTEKDSTTDQLGLLNDAAKMSERIDAKTEALRKQARLSARQIEVLDDLVSQIVTNAMVAQQLPDTKPIVDSLKAQVDQAPEEQRAELLAEIERMEQGADALRNHAEARATFGDAAVDAVLPKVPELTALRHEMVAIYQTLR